MSSKRLLPSGWIANLALRYEVIGGRSAMVKRTHYGPLMVQKPLYPEGPEVCHTIILHPPGGIVGGDVLDIDGELGCSSRVLMTTSGADRWYRSAGEIASQRIHFAVGAGAILEWLPQESIFFDGALADINVRIELRSDATYAGWEIWSFGRRASGESFSCGEVSCKTEIWRDSNLLWHERARLQGGDSFLVSPLGLNGHGICGTFIVAGKGCGSDAVTALRHSGIQLSGTERAGATLLAEVLIVRYLGSSTYRAKSYFEKIWGVLRPWFANRPGHIPRIWRT